MVYKIRMQHYNQICKCCIFLKFLKVLSIFNLLSKLLAFKIKMQEKITKFNNNKEIKIKLVVNQIDIKDSFKLLKYYNGVQCYLDNNPENIKTIY